MRGSRFRCRRRRRIGRRCRSVQTRFERFRLYERQDDGSWVHTVYEAEGDLEFRCGGLYIRFSLAEIYEDVVFS